MNPTSKPVDNLPRVYRGGSWNVTSAPLVRAAYRYVNTPSVRSGVIGFRCALRGRASRA